jgi:hypothetical protein
MSKKTEGKTEMTYTRLSTYLRCPMEEYYRYQVNGTGIQSTKPFLPFIEGTLTHYGLEHWHKSGLMLRENMLKKANALIVEAGGVNGLEPEAEDKLRSKLAAMIGACLAYKQYYTSDKEKYETLFVEGAFAFELDGFILRGKVDRLSKEVKTGKVIQWENKSSGAVSKDTYVAMPMSFQDLLYCEGCHSLTGEYPDLMQRDYIIKSALRRKKDKSGGRESLAGFEARVAQQYLDTPEKKFFRTPPLRVLKTTMNSVKKQLSIILGNYKDNKPFMNFASCTGMYGQACPFIGACTAKLQGKDDGWDAAECRGMYKLKPCQHPELVKEKD